MNAPVVRLLWSPVPRSTNGSSLSQSSYPYSNVLSSGTGILGMSSSRNRSASASDTRRFPFSTPVPLGPACLLSSSARSILFPTTTQQKSSASSSGIGALALNASHHFVSAVSVSGRFTSNINNAASAPRKNAVDKLEKRSWPAVS